MWFLPVPSAAPDSGSRDEAAEQEHCHCWPWLGTGLGSTVHLSGHTDLELGVCACKASGRQTKKMDGDS